MSLSYICQTTCRKFSSAHFHCRTLERQKIQVRLYTRSIPVIELVDKIKQLRSFGVKNILMGSLRDVGVLENVSERMRVQGRCHDIVHNTMEPNDQPAYITGGVVGWALMRCILLNPPATQLPKDSKDFSDVIVYIFPH